MSRLRAEVARGRLGRALPGLSCYRELLREEIAQTLSDPSAVDEELRSLRAVLAS